MGSSNLSVDTDALRRRGGHHDEAAPGFRHKATPDTAWLDNFTRAFGNAANGFHRKAKRHMSDRETAWNGIAGKHGRMGETCRLAAEAFDDGDTAAGARVSRGE